MFVNGARDQIFSHAAFAADQHGGVRGRDALDQREHGLHFVAVRDDILVVVAVAERLAQVAVFLAQVVRIASSLRMIRTSSASENGFST